MRVLAFLAAASLATPAAAQLLPPAPGAAGSPQYAEALAQQEITRQQLVQQQNQLSALEAQLHAQQGLADIQALRVVPRIPTPDTASGRPLPQIDTSQLATIPDAALADSNRKVLEAAGPPR